MDLKQSFYEKLDFDVANIASRNRLKYYIEYTFNEIGAYDKMFRIVYSYDNYHFAFEIDFRLYCEMLDSDIVYSGVINKLEKEVQNAFGSSTSQN